MATVGVLAHFEFKPDRIDDAAQFFQAGAVIVADQPETTRWFAFRLGPSSYGAFAVFANEADRDALLASGGPRSSRVRADLFVREPTFEKVEVVAARDVDGRGQLPTDPS